MKQGELMACLQVSDFLSVPWKAAIWRWWVVMGRHYKRKEVSLTTRWCPIPGDWSDPVYLLLKLI